MLLLVTDTSGRDGSVALVRDVSTDGVEVVESAPLEGGTFSAQLVPQISKLLTNHAMRKSDIDAFIVVSGPGSFTGLRVGLAAIKALAEILAKPIVAVSLLEVAALAAGSNGKILAVLDAGRSEVHAGEYEVAGGSARLLQQHLLRKEGLSSVAAGTIVVTPDDALAEIARAAGLSASSIGNVNAGMIARLGLRKLRAGEIFSPERLEANYGRRSDAEIFAKLGP